MHLSFRHLSFRHLRFLAVAALAAPAAVLGVACASGGAALPGDGTDFDPNGIPNQICLLLNCNADQECGACTGSRTRCFLPEHRCVACDGETGEGCAEGEICTRFGTCVRDGLSCPTDDHGVPTITCATNEDCLACDPLHQVCDTATGLCVACAPDQTSACQSIEACVNGFCASKCPQVCNTDADCSACGAPGHELRVCNAHQCSECSADQPCPAGQACSPQGTCVTLCGGDGQGACSSGSDCDGCSGDATACLLPGGGGAGKCGVQSATCAELGGDTTVLPAPWDGVTSCTGDAQCAGVTADVNVGAMLRDLTGIETIGDATAAYGMDVCASVTITGSKTCGVCVPCKVDADCGPIEVDPISEPLFGPPGSVSSAYLIDQVFGPNEHKVHMYCETVGPGFGICSPCPGYLNDCSVGGGGTGGTCDHDACTSGGPLSGDCDDCAAAVCAIDDFCCTTAWDAQCIAEADAECGTSCAPAACVHSECVAGAKLEADCSECAATVCGADAFCCDNTWDNQCVAEAATTCSIGCAGGTCAHSECQTGGKLTDGCSSCVSLICDNDPFCCNNSWDSQCVSKVGMFCAVTCG